MSRIEKATKNIMYSYIGNTVTILLKFLSRTVFIYTIGVEYLGVNALYSNILAILSFAELGIGSAMNYSLYKPVAKNDVEKIKSLMLLYKYAYRWIALVIAVMGLLFTPFLKYIITDAGILGTNELIIYYLIFLFNTVTSYLVVYKFSLPTAEQKNFIQTNIQTITSIVITILQMIALIITKSFLVYLLIGLLIGLIQKIFSNRYINKLYPFLLDKSVKKLPKAERELIIKNVKALIMHKIGEVSVYQSDNILVSAFINITTVGIISNYNLMITSATTFINIMFGALISSFGNLISTESTEKQYEIFKVYRFVGFWCFGFASIAFSILLNPFIDLWLGKEMLLANLVIYLIMIDYYFKGHRIVLNNFKSAAGIFDEDKYIGFAQGIVNIIVSIILVNKIGLPGIYIGTIVQGLVSNLTRPRIVYNKVFHKGCKEYYKDSFIYMGIITVTFLIIKYLNIVFLSTITFVNFIILMLVVTLLANLIFLLALKNRDEFKYLTILIKTKLNLKGR